MLRKQKIIATITIILFNFIKNAVCIQKLNFKIKLKNKIYYLILNKKINLSNFYFEVI